MYRLGHCASYHTIKEIENEMTAKSVKATPFRLSLNTSAATGFCIKDSGKDTFHDTVGIAYQVLDNSQPNI